MPKHGNYVVIQDWMVQELGLKGNDLILYAVIYGFSQTEGQWFTGSAQYLADWCQGHKKWVLTKLKQLCERGLLQKRERDINGVRFCDYRAVIPDYTNSQETLPPVRNPYHPGKETLPPPVRNPYHPGKETLPHNIEDNIKDNLEREDAPAGASDLSLSSPLFDAKPRNVEEVRAYCRERRNRIDAQTFCDYYDANGWRQGSGKPIQDWKAVIRLWEKREGKPLVSTPKRNEPVDRPSPSGNDFLRRKGRLRTKQS